MKIAEPHNGGDRAAAWDRTGAARAGGQSPVARRGRDGEEKSCARGDAGDAAIEAKKRRRELRQRTPAGASQYA